MCLGLARVNPTRLKIQENLYPYVFLDPTFIDKDIRAKSRLITM
jgi:hypothetical protein